MAITTRLLRNTRPLALNFPSSSSPSSSSLVRCSGINNKEKSNVEKRISTNGDKKSNNLVVKVASVASEIIISTESPTKAAAVYLSLVAGDVADVALRIWKPLVKRRSWKQQLEMLIEKGVVNCRFFTLLAVAGTLLGSILCFVEGCYLIVHSYFEYFRTMSKHNSDEGHVVQLLIEAIDMFLVGSAMLIFGVGLYALFMGARDLKRENGGLFASNFFGLFHLKMLPGWVEMQCVSQAKSKIGHALLMILQVGVVDKFKNVPLVTGLDLACFAGAILVSSACIFLLSRLSLVKNEGGK